ncbi:hypothetical protein Pmar_PMAR006809 [Perkinsus marinus ATCC 50983]|uniref:Vacuolar ATPase assembly integral membrane protein VMA21 n=1 Tax=Perkinsus marinus (strain ATCC 50983 / TXsc) TaxID=423536 RepID=C5K6J6_PERM5|nr:hypothetical protein Pmar_PMAR006809 [Perkinsus marinus ATCC 50983]EER19916.1 hypothetical protein Pmar_PMAR006809 [Perkinsus marinus ATCC 50983]|eukprot:XP_002788120.1 hypothetical protein Pmar_PMAR006809 [Perkinsus marinus ATCC 50983]
MARKQANKKESTEEKSVPSDQQSEMTAKNSQWRISSSNKNKGPSTEIGSILYTLFGLLSHEENRKVAIPFAFTALAMFVVPISVFFAVQAALPGMGITDDNKILSYSGISAVISANIIMALYAFYAYQEEKHDWAAVQEKKKDDKKKN